MLWPLLFINVIASAGFLVTGYSYVLNPASFSVLACSGLAFPIFAIIVFAFLFLWLMVRKRYALLPLATLVVGYAPMRKYSPINFPHDEPSSCLRIISYNVHAFFSPLEEGGENMEAEQLDFLRHSGADILCLQEAYLSDALRDSLRSVFPYMENLSKESNSVACVSKYPILKVAPIKYNSKGNCSACFYVKYKNDTLRVINNHLETTAIDPDDKAEFRTMIKGSLKDNVKMEGTKRIMQTLAQSMVKRSPQAEAVAKFVGKDARNTIVVGDFNDTPISYSHHVVDEVLTDCYAERGMLMGFSYEQNGMHVRIDHAFCSSDFEVAKCYVDKSVRFSDHYPLRLSLFRP